MLLNLTDLSSESLQSQIARQIRALILAGELMPDSSLPSIRALATEQKVSVITVQRAYEHLLREGLIHSRRGKGFFVSYLKKDEKKSMAQERLLQNLESHISGALNEGLQANEIKAMVELILKKNGERKK
ncbi:MAG TPA: GntR family transcriptional regulator [bacterium]